MYQASKMTDFTVDLIWWGLLRLVLTKKIHYTVGVSMALWGERNEPSIQHIVYIFMQHVDS